MGDIKVGEYARCGSIGIAKVCSIEEMPNLQDKGKFQFVDEQGRRIEFKYIQKHNELISKIIESGDLVNGIFCSLNDIQRLKEYDIQTIVTHEQIERDTYYV